MKRRSFHGNSKTNDKSQNKKTQKVKETNPKTMYLNKKIRAMDHNNREGLKSKYNLNARYAFSSTVKQVDLTKMIQTNNKHHLDSSMKMVI
jgi:hypothetical protein